MNLILRNLSYNYGQHRVLNSISCSFSQGDMVAIIGQNGSGKSTLLHCINKILVPESGSVVIDNELLSEMSMQHIAERIAYVPQYSDADIYATVFEAVLLGRRPYINGAPCKEDYEKVATSIVQMDLKELSMRRVNSLSGGERQRVMIARAMAQTTNIILLDEPISSLDIKHQYRVMLHLKELSEQGKIVLVTLHDLTVATRFCNKVLMLKDGKVLAYGAPEICTPERVKNLYDIDFELEFYKH